MKRLYLLRHAKSSWDDPALPDHRRPLAPRGKRAAERMAEHLAREGIRPALVLCSSATRARQTLKRIAPALGDARVEIEDGLYGTAAERLLERLRRVPDDVDSVLLVGHNPGLQDLALLLAAAGADLGRLEEKLPTGALAALAVRAERWSDLAPGGAEVVALVVPREL